MSVTLKRGLMVANDFCGQTESLGLGTEQVCMEKGDREKGDGGIKK
ncbi:MAG: hypothetical protein JSU67_16375 [Gammaproteobacteria bacterium]|nr:MAG: hypothetical protein JSU67_16375 [Gammaproteobacteria bacterium]